MTGVQKQGDPSVSVFSDGRAASPHVTIVSADTLLAAALSTLLGEKGVLDVSAAKSFEEIPPGVPDRPSAVVYDLSGSGSGPFDPGPIAAFTARGRKAPVVVLTTSERFEVVPALLEAGVRGIVGRDADADEFVAAVTEVAGGRVFLSRGMMDLLVAHVARCPVDRAAAHLHDTESLAPRERDIVRLLSTGMTNREIAAALHVSEGTVKTHLGRVMVKWSVRDRLQVVLRAIGRLHVTPADLPDGDPADPRPVGEAPSAVQG